MKRKAPEVVAFIPFDQRPWTIGLPHGSSQPYFNIVNAKGHVIAGQVFMQKYAWLIVQLPEMLTICEDLLDSLNLINPNDLPGSVVAAKCILTEVIAKAKGEAL